MIIKDYLFSSHFHLFFMTLKLGHSAAQAARNITMAFWEECCTISFRDTFQNMQPKKNYWFLCNGQWLNDSLNGIFVKTKLIYKFLKIKIYVALYAFVPMFKNYLFSFTFLPGSKCLLLKYMK